MEAQSHVDYFVEETRWRPNATLLLAGALRAAEYDDFKQQIVKHIVMQGGGPADAERDHEFTNWQALATFSDAFLEMDGVGTIDRPPAGA